MEQTVTMTQTIQVQYNSNIRIIENDNTEDDLLDIESHSINTKGKTIKTKMNITNISKYVPVLTIDETYEIEEIE